MLIAEALAIDFDAREKRAAQFDLVLALPLDLDRQGLTAVALVLGQPWATAAHRSAGWAHQPRSSSAFSENRLALLPSTDWALAAMHAIIRRRVLTRPTW